MKTANTTQKVNGVNPYFNRWYVVSNKLCGQYRKGHFRGVINIVNRLLEITKPKKIFLGNKDFQQLVLIKKHIKKNKISTKVIPCKTIRDKNFVA